MLHVSVAAQGEFVSTMPRADAEPSRLQEGEHMPFCDFSNFIFRVK